MEPISPFKALRLERGLTKKQMCEWVGLSFNQVAGLEAGSILHVMEHYRAGFEAAGLDFDKLRADYAQWHDGLQKGWEVDLPEDHPLRAALAKGVRGLNNLAKASGMKAEDVRAFLRGEAL